MTNLAKLVKAKKEVNKLWALMCKEDGVPVDAKFVVFTSTNSYAVKYNEAVKKYFRLRSSASGQQLDRLWEATR